MASFLKGGRFLLASPNAYNSLGVGTTQLYNKTVVYNHKRHGEYRVGRPQVRFPGEARVPEEAHSEFLLVDLVNNLDQLAESRNEVLERVQKQAAVLARTEPAARGPLLRKRANEEVLCAGASNVPGAQDAR